MAYWAFEILHVFTEQSFHGGVYYFDEDEEDVSELMLAERTRFLDCQSNKTTFMFNTDAGYVTIPPSVLKDCSFFSFMCHSDREPITYEH